MKVTPRHLRNSFIGIWVGFFLLNLGINAYLHLVLDWIGDENFWKIIKTLSAIYSPFIGIGIIYIAVSSFKSKDIKVRAGSFMIFLVLIYNLVLTVFSIPLIHGSGDIAIYLKNISNTSSTLGWLVAGSSGYFFSLQSTN